MQKEKDLWQAAKCEFAELLLKLRESEMGPGVTGRVKKRFSTAKIPVKATLSAPVLEKAFPAIVKYLRWKVGKVHGEVKPEHMNFAWPDMRLKLVRELHEARLLTHKPEKEQKSRLGGIEVNWGQIVTISPVQTKKLRAFVAEKAK